MVIRLYEKICPKKGLCENVFILRDFIKEQVIWYLFTNKKSVFLRNDFNSFGCRNVVFSYKITLKAIKKIMIGFKNRDKIA